MHPIDWFVLVGTTLFIALYGIWKTRRQASESVRSYLLSDNDTAWWMMGLSIMATQASAITFLSTPGLAYGGNMEFAQFYMGMPLACVLVAFVAVPLYRKANVFTAYEYLETRFDLKTRLFGATLFLLQRGLAAGFTIYAPALVLSTLFGWHTGLTCVAVGAVVTAYTALGGTRAVNQTQMLQMGVMLGGLAVAGVVIVLRLPPEVGFGRAIHIAGEMGRLQIIDTTWNPNDRYNLWSGLLAGTFLMLSYFGTDQSQVQRYLGGKSVRESQVGLLFNGVFKVPMQLSILFVGVLLFVFYQFTQPPVIFHGRQLAAMQAHPGNAAFQGMASAFAGLHDRKRAAILQGDFATARTLADTAEAVHKQALTEAATVLGRPQEADNDRVFLTFVIEHMPVGLIGLIVAMVLAAGMSSASSELNALATTTVMDVYKRNFRPNAPDAHYLRLSRAFTVGWGAYAIGFSLFAHLLGSLIEAVNIIGSLVYGTILGIFMVGFFVKQVRGNAVFVAALITQAAILSLYVLTRPGPLAFFMAQGLDFRALDIAFLWYNALACLMVMALAGAFQWLWGSGRR